MNTNFLVRKTYSNKTLGIEIEGFSTEFYGVHEYSGFWFITTDGSIVPPSYNHYGREFVSQPLTAEHLKREIRKLHKNYKLEFNKSCGVHVHASKKWVSEAKAEKIWKFIQTLSHVEFEILFGRRPNRYCVKHPDPTMGARYHAINTTNDKTVEFRMFNSGGADWCQYCVDMVVYLIENANHLNIDAAFAFRDLAARKYSLSA